MLSCRSQIINSLRFNSATSSNHLHSLLSTQSANHLLTQFRFKSITNPAASVSMSSAVLPVEEFPKWGLLPKKETGVLNLLSKYPEYDGRGVVIAIFDSGVDPGAPGLQVTSDGKPKIIERYDCGGGGDVDTSTIVKVDDTDHITGLSGRKLKIPSSWKNPTGDYHIGLKNAYDLYPKTVQERISKERKEKLWNPLHKKAQADAQMNLQSFLQKHSDTKANNLSRELKLQKEDLESMVESLNSVDKKFNCHDLGPAYDVITFHNGEYWCVCVDTSESGDLQSSPVLGEYTVTRDFTSLTRPDQLNFSVNVHEEGKVTELVGLCSGHGTHVASIAAGYWADEPEKNGVAPGAQIISLTIGDNRLCTMETGSAIARAMNRALQKSPRPIHVINMSYGEHSHWSDAGRLAQLMNQVVDEAGVVWVCSAGNRGPATCTVGTPPDIDTSNIIGIGAYVSPEMMEAEYALREKQPSTVYTWSSRGPTRDGARGVTVVAPGAAITAVPCFTLRKTQHMNGTSMSAPHASGAVALLLSCLQQKGLSYSPYSVKRALEVTAQYIPSVEPFAQGFGLMQVEQAMEWLVKYHDEIETKVRFHVTTGNSKNKGIHMRVGDQQVPREVSVSVEPVFADSSNIDPEVKLNFSMSLSLTCSVPWVQIPNHLELMNMSRQFNVKIDPSNLTPGIHNGTIFAFDSNKPEKGHVFCVDVTIVKPVVLGSNPLIKPELSWDKVDFKANTIKHEFVLVPKEATVAVLKLQANTTDAQGKFIIHCMQHKPKLCHAIEIHKVVTVNAQSEVVIPFQVHPDRILEVTIAKFWTNLGDINISYRLSFRGCRPDMGNTLHLYQHDGVRRVEVNGGVQIEDISPILSLKSGVSILKPSEPARILPLTSRDLIPTGRLTYELLLNYTFHLAKSAEVTPANPYLCDVLYESPFESQLWMLHDSNKRLLAVGDAYPDKYHVKLEKGDYTIRHQVRHEKKDLLEKLTDMPLTLTQKLSSPINLDLYSCMCAALSGGKKANSASVHPGNVVYPLYIAPLTQDKLKNVVGHYLTGTLSLLKDEPLKKVDTWNVKYYMSEVSKKPNNSNNNSNSNTNGTNSNTNNKSESGGSSKDKDTTSISSTSAAKTKLEEFEKCLQSDQVGTDLRNCKQLLKKHQVTEQEIHQWEQRIADLVAVGSEMAHEDHFNADAILQASKETQEKFKSLEEPAILRKEVLEESLRFHKFGFELETELCWIREHLPLASSETLGVNLHQAQSLHKKHKKLVEEIQGHQPMIDKTIKSGQALVHQKHPETKQVSSLCTGLQDAWQELIFKAKERSKKLELSLKAQQFFYEASEVESWLSERNDVLSSTDYGRDRDAASKLLTKHKAVELELDTYSSIVSEMGNSANTMINAKHPDSKAIANKQQAITQQIKNLQKLATARQQRLVESMCRHEYLTESAELEEWIKENMQAAASEDYGQDYEHLMILVNKFYDLKHKVENSQERFNQCEELAQKLVSNESPYLVDIEKKQEQLRESWQQLLGLLENREQRLNAAGEIHRFHRDVAEALSRIHDKDAALSDDLGKDSNTVLALIRKHEGFENDLVALEAQLQVLVEDAVRLQALYPGHNANHIAQQQAAVVSSWSALQERSAQRKDALQASCDLHKFLAQVRDLMSWAAGLRAAMLTEEKVRNAASAQILKAEHEALKAEIEAREASFRQVMELGEAMVQGGHYANEEIQEKFSQLVEERQKLHSSWQHKKVHLDQLIDLHFFLRDAKQIDALSNSQEVALASSDCGETVDEVSNLVKKHEEFEKLLATQEDKVLALQEHGDKLLAQNHFESKLIAQRLNEVIDRRVQVKQLCVLRKQRLEDALLYAQFVRDIAETELWMDEKQKKLDVEANKSDISSLEDKIKKLQKHQAFQAELAANQPRITTIKEKGETLLSKKHKLSREIKTQLDNLLSAWRHLLQESSNRGRGLEEAQDILEFNNQVDKIEAWIRDKEMMVQAGEMGRDYEHCLALQRKLDDVDSDMRVDDSRIKSINNLADKLIRQGRSDTRSVQQRRQHFNNKWRGLQGALTEYRERLAGALEIHLFNRDVDDTSQRVSEKAVTMATEDTGRDLSEVERLQRKQDALERDMTAIEGKLKEHDHECRRLVQKYPDMSAPIRTKLTELQDNWRNLQTLAASRREALNSAFSQHKFTADLKELESYVAETMKRMNTTDLPSNIPEAKALLELHHERKAEIDGRQETFKTLKEFGLKVSPPREPELTRLDELRRQLAGAWEEQRTRLDHAHQAQMFKEAADQAENWLVTKEAFLNNDDIGESLSGVEALLRKHKAFEKALEAQLSRIDDLEKFAKDLLAEHHYDSSGIQQRLQSVIARKDRLKESSTARRKRLIESRQMQQFLRNMYEVGGWILQKHQIAADESYRDSTNLQSKIQKHAAFESELAANKNRVGAVTAEGESLISGGHFAAVEIQTRLNELESEWRQLQESSALKRERLNDAYQALLFNRTLEELEAWSDEVETQLQSEDHGKDLASVMNLLKRHTLLENDVHSHVEALTQLQDTAALFQRSNHFMKNEINDRAQSVIKRYRSLQEPMQIRRDNLEDALLLYQYLRDVDDEMQWLIEKEPLAMSSDLGNSLTAVQSLQKKHQALETELASREPVVSALASRAQQMSRSAHFAAARIEGATSALQEKLGSLRDAASVRRLRLLDALESQMFYAEVAEAEVWLKEKKPILHSNDFGRDEDSVLSLIKKLEGVERELVSFQHTVGHLSKLCQNLLDRNHFDSKNISKKQAEIESEYNSLNSLCKLREARLVDSKKLYKFLREAEEVAEWISDQTAVAASEDYGRDVEHVELLIQTFESFLNGLSASESRVTSCLTSGRTLLSENHPESARINTKLEETQQLWEDLKELSHARQEALAGAKQVHVFDRTADETIAWILEKDAVICAEDYGQDLETIQSLVRKHEGFEADLAAVKEQVESVVQEAGRLSALFPDAREHIEVKHEETLDAWTTLIEKAGERKSKLNQAEQLQSYFDQYRDLMAWINEMLAKITASELSHDVAGAELLLSRHQEFNAEINSRNDVFNQFYETGNKLITQGHFLSNEIQEKIKILEARHQLLNDTWESRHHLYKQNLDTQLFKREADQLESWIQSREPILQDKKLGESIGQVEELIRKHDDFEKTIEAQEERFNALRKITLLEQAFVKQKEAEQAARIMERERVEKERLEARKRREVQRITDERKREDTRRRVLDPTREDNTVNGDDGLSSEYVESSSLVIRTTTTSMTEIVHVETETISEDYLETDLDRLNVPNSLHKSGSISSLFGDKMRKDLKRAESMKADLTKKPKRTPSFTTRRRTQSFRKLQKLEQLDQLPPVEIQGVLERKHELQSGGKKAAVRSWKSLYTVLCGQLLCFFKDQDDFVASKAATSPIIIFKARCEKAGDYTKRKHVFRLYCTDGSEFLFLAPTETLMEDWVNKISFHAQLPPSLQLLSYDDSQKESSPTKAPPSLPTLPGAPDHSSSSSKDSTPEMKRWQQQKPQPPMTSPRGAPPPIPVRSMSNESMPATVNMRPKHPIAVEY
uniref:Tripeptidyl-peptidase 2 n=1 Tax=Cacopsylla melanoneura TaxID=428564 RepID=A0A8D8XL88_9HEMI